MIEKGSDDVLEWTPGVGASSGSTTSARSTGALITITGDPEPELLSDLDQARVGKARPVKIAEAHLRNVMDRRGQLDDRQLPERGLGADGLRRARRRAGSGRTSSTRSASTSPTRSPRGTSTSTRLDERCRLAERAPLRRDPLPRPRHRSDGRAQREVALGVRQHRRRSSAAATSRTCRPRRSSRRRTGGAPRAPSARRCRSRCPGNIIRDLELTFEGGRIVDVKASTGEDYVRAQVAADEGAAQLGEVALVDGTSRVGQIGHIFFNTLFDENATCHIAYGRGIAYCVEGASDLDEAAQQEAGVNQSTVHTDFMIGGPEVDGRRRDGGAARPCRSSATTPGSSS